jgi:hypothetical protein
MWPPLSLRTLRAMKERESTTNYFELALSVLGAVLSLVAAGAAASWVLTTGLTGWVLYIAFGATGLIWWISACIHATENDSRAALVLFTGFPVLCLATAFFLGAFASWSPFFVPIIPTAVVVAVIAYRAEAATPNQA